MKTKNQLKLHSALGIISILLLSCKIFLPFLSLAFPFLFLPQTLFLFLGKVGIFFGLSAFISGCGLGNYPFVQNSKYTEIHVLLLLAGLILQIPSVSENHSNFYANIISKLGYPLLIAGWVYGRKIRRYQ
ncbi:putative lipoprotein [Leptospira santarosai str. CBC523]|uniref:Putative lipoprotein n=1 Tax=Leptospira santarosai str. ZUN179 TaxID=1049985 RepID=M6UT75_9LEPT|nr:lipoprotein [Leptospira santarosai]EMO14709.1 putative lipoprotein [Leptospira santarosai str. CBC523]EMO44239.1 putative lipoprotein [Leptospira santarosai str. ZUN179]